MRLSVASVCGCVCGVVVVVAQADLDLNAPLTALATAAMIIICVDSADTPQCLKLVKKMRGVEGGGSRHGAGVVSLQRGVKNGSKVADL